MVELGLILTALLTAGAVDNQQHQLNCISDAKNIVLNAFEGKKESYPDDLKTALQQMVKQLRKGETKLHRSLNFFRGLSWLPAFAGIVPHIYYHSGYFSQALRCFKFNFSHFF